MPLTPRAQQRFGLLCEAESDDQVLIGSLQARISDALTLQNSNPHGENAARRLAEIDRLRTRMTDLQARFQSRSILNGRIREWLARSGDQEITDAKLVKLGAIENHVAAVESLRDELKEVIADRLAVQQAGVSKAEMKARAKEYVSERAKKFRPRMRIDHENFELQTAHDVWDAQSKITMTDLLAWLDPEKMTARLNAEIDTLPPVKGQLLLSRAERAKRLASLDASIIHLERREVGLLDAAAKVGTFIPFRSTTSPEAVLGVIVKHRVTIAA